MLWIISQISDYVLLIVLREIVGGIACDITKMIIQIDRLSMRIDHIQGELPQKWIESVSLCSSDSEDSLGNKGLQSLDTYRNALG